MIWTGKQIEAALFTKVSHQLVTGKIQFNSKDVRKGDLFVAINGGEAYVEDAIEMGAAAVIVAGVTKRHEKVIVVPNALDALIKLAQYKRNTSKAKFIAITGSSGKTSVKEALQLILGKFGSCFASRGNFNNHLGVPINLASMPDDAKYGVFELGMSSANEISKLTNLVRPHIAVITSIAEAHLQFFNSVLDIVDAKCEIFQGLNNEGVAIINRDCLYYNYILKKLTTNVVKNIYTFGESSKAYSRLMSYNIAKNTKLSYSVNDSVVNFSIPYILPKHQAINFSACLAVVASLGLDLTSASQSLQSFDPGQGRGKIIQVQKANHKFEIICDYYNANPASVKAALNYLKIIIHQKKVIIFGDMLELGTDSQKLHQELSQTIIDTSAQKVLLVGEHVKIIAEFLPKSCYVRLFANVNDLMSELSHILEDGELILIKGSKSIGLNKVMQYFD
ncbi:MAG: UDP-N-acetylmuramoyl-tripeptide--D-alanyl-D-alanine ligase [Rickettsiaceae bacterium]|nr:MAG: UDP-N-acetylmuramoyl-tripeptide--D-alanyl-D-alanine ligase [Rickettsiaceae bacterium]